MTSAMMLVLATLMDGAMGALKPPLLNNAKLDQGAHGIYRAYGFEFAAMLEAANIAQAAK